MPWVGFEIAIPAFERAKTVHASDRAATVTSLRDQLRERLARPHSPSGHGDEEKAPASRPDLNVNYHYEMEMTAVYRSKQE
jgi:hypothetical protein